MSDETQHRFDDEEAGSFHRVAAVRDIPSRKAIVREVNGYEIAIFHLGEAFYAVSNLCPHQHAPVIAAGILTGNTVICPMHGWSYDVTTGKSVEASGCLKTYELRVQGNDLYVRVPDHTAEAAW